MYRVLAAWERSGAGATGSCPLRTRWWAQIAVASWLVSRTAFRRFAARELSAAAGTGETSAATPAWSRRIGAWSFAVGPQDYTGSRSIALSENREKAVLSDWA